MDVTELNKDQLEELRGSYSYGLLDNGDVDYLYITEQMIRVKVIGSAGNYITIIVPTTDHYRLRSILDKVGYNDYKIIDWKIEKIKIVGKTEI